MLLGLECASCPVAVIRVPEAPPTPTSSQRLAGFKYSCSGGPGALWGVWTSGDARICSQPLTPVRINRRWRVLIFVTSQFRSSCWFLRRRRSADTSLLLTFKKKKAPLQSQILLIRFQSGEFSVSFLRVVFPSPQTPSRSRG